MTFWTESYIMSQQYLFQFTRPFFPFFLFLGQTLTADVVIAKASNPSKSSVLWSHHPSNSSSDSNLFRLQWRPSTTFLRYASKFYSPSISRHLVFLFLSSSFHPITRKWGMKSWSHQLWLLISIFLGLWVTLIHPISSIKKPTKFPSNCL